MACSSCGQKYIQPPQENPAGAGVPAPQQAMPPSGAVGGRYIPPTVMERIIREQAQILADQQAQAGQPSEEKK